MSSGCTQRRRLTRSTKVIDQKEYDVIIHQRLVDLIAKVNKKLNEGWHLVGGIAVDKYGHMFQAMIKG